MKKNTGAVHTSKTKKAERKGDNTKCGYIKPWFGALPEITPDEREECRAMIYGSLWRASDPVETPHP